MANVIQLDSLRLRGAAPRFRCGRATHPPAPVASNFRATTPFKSWSEIGIGMLVPSLRCGEPCRASRGLLESAFATWMAQADDLKVLLLVDCSPGTPPAAQTAEAALRGVPPPFEARYRARANTLWQCYSTPAALGRTLWRKTDALLHALARRMPRKSFYFKIDLDTL